MKKNRVSVNSSKWREVSREVYGQISTKTRKRVKYNAGASSNRRESTRGGDLARKSEISSRLKGVKQTAGPREIRSWVDSNHVTKL